MIWATKESAIRFAASRLRQETKRASGGLSRRLPRVEASFSQLGSRRSARSIATGGRGVATWGRSTRSSATVGRLASHAYVALSTSAGKIGPRADADIGTRSVHVRSTAERASGSGARAGVYVGTRSGHVSPGGTSVNSDARSSHPRAAWSGINADSRG